MRQPRGPRTSTISSALSRGAAYHKLQPSSARAAYIGVEGIESAANFQTWNLSNDGTAARALRCLRRGCGKFSLWRGNNSLRSFTMRKILGIAVIAISLTGGATVDWPNPVAI